MNQYHLKQRDLQNEFLGMTAIVISMVYEWRAVRMTGWAIFHLKAIAERLQSWHTDGKRQ